MKTLTLNIPDALDLSEQEATHLLAVSLYQKGALSLGQAAEMVDYSKEVFMEMLANYGVSLFNYTESDLENELTNAKRYHIRH